MHSPLEKYQKQLGSIANVTINLFPYLTYIFLMNQEDNIVIAALPLVIFYAFRRTALFMFSSLRHDYNKIRKKSEVFNLFNAGIVFIVWSVIFFLGAVPIYKNFDTSSLIMFIAGILLILGVAMLMINFINKTDKKISLRDIAITMMVASVGLVGLMQGANLNFVNLIVPELSLIIGLICLAVSISRK